jgi:general secretion pathway protein J
MRSSRNNLPDYESGFTLIELLVSLTILALLLAMVPGTLRLGKRAWETPGQLEDNPAAAALQFAGQQLKRALPVYQTDSAGLPHIAFEGTESNVNFIAELASGPAGGGLYRIDIGPQRSSGNAFTGPVVRLELYRPDPRASAPGIRLPAEERELGASYSDVQFKYYGSPAPGQPAAWQPAWNRSDRLPDLVDISAKPKTGTNIPQAQYRAELKMRPIL